MIPRPQPDFSGRELVVDEDENLPKATEEKTPDEYDFFSKEAIEAYQKELLRLAEAEKNNFPRFELDSEFEFIEFPIPEDLPLPRIKEFVERDPVFIYCLNDEYHNNQKKPE